MKYRIAKPFEARKLANLHYHVRDRYIEGIFLSLGKNFLEKYYKIILNDPYQVIVCAEKENGTVVGFISMSLCSEKQMQNLRKHRICLGLAALGAVISKPYLFKALWQRYKSISDETAPKFIMTHGPRVEYWCWLVNESENDPLASLELWQVKDDILRALGATEYYGEVDVHNKQIIKYQMRRGEVVDQIKLPDGRERLLMRIKLTK